MFCFQDEQTVGGVQYSSEGTDRPGGAGVPLRTFKRGASVVIQAVLGRDELQAAKLERKVRRLVQPKEKKGSVGTPTFRQPREDNP